MPIHMNKLLSLQVNFSKILKAFEKLMKKVYGNKLEYMSIEQIYVLRVHVAIVSMGQLPL